MTFGVSWLLYLHRYTFGLIKPSIQQEWGLSNKELGMLDGVFQGFYMGAQVPLGIAADTLGVYLILPLLILVWSIGLAMHAWAPSFEAMVWARITLAVGQSAAYASVNRIARIWFPKPIRTTLQGLAGVLAGRLGGMCAGLIFATILLGAMGIGWRSAILMFAAFGVGYAILFRIFFRNSPAEHPGVNKAEAALFTEEESETKPVGAPKMTRMQLLRSLKPRAKVNMICLNVQSILSTFADNIFSTWIPLFLFQEFALKFKEMGIYSALPLLGGAIGGLVGGVLNDWIIARTGNRRWTRSGVACFGKGMAAVVLFTALFWFESPYVFCGFLFFVKFFGDWSLTTAWGVVTDIGGKATASVFAFNNTVAGIGGLVAPLLYGFLVDEFSWRVVFITAGGLYALCAISWLFINCTIPMFEESME